MVDWIVTEQNHLQLYKSVFIDMAGAIHPNEMRHTSLVCAFLTFGLSLAGPVLRSICCASRLAEQGPCESQAGKNAGDLTLTLTLCEIVD